MHYYVDSAEPGDIAVGIEKIFGLVSRIGIGQSAVHTLCRIIDS